MSDDVMQRLQQMRDSFDAGFALPTLVAADDLQHLLTIRINDDGFMLPVASIRAIALVSRVVMLPSPLPELLGVVGLRGELVPLYDLGALLGYPSAGKSPRWFVQIGANDPVGLAFEHFDGYRLARPGDRSPLSAAAVSTASKVNAADRPFLREVVRLDDRTSSLIDLESLLKTLRSRVQAVRTEKE